MPSKQAQKKSPPRPAKKTTSPKPSNGNGASHAIRAAARKMRGHDPANVATVEDLADEPLVQGEVLRPGRLTLDGRRGAKIIWKTLLQLDRGRGRALREESKRLDKSPSTLVAQALAAFGIGGDYVEGEGV